jgi:hypothetical protein
MHYSGADGQLENFIVIHHSHPYNVHLNSC